MFGRYGNYSHDSNEVALNGISRRALLGENGVQWAVRTQYDLAGRLQASTLSALTAKIAALEAAYVSGQGDWALYNDDGSLTAHYIQAANTAGGIIVTNLASYPVGNSAEYVFLRNYTISLYADVLTLTSNLRSFSETVSFTGGGPVRGFLECLNGPPQAQTLKQATTYKATQRGIIVGNVDFIYPPAPLWPGDEHTDRRQSERTSPTRVGITGAPYNMGWKWSYGYFFESISPLDGGPNRQLD